MASDILRRRAELQAKLDEYEGCEFGVCLSQAVVLAPYGVTPIVAIPANCTSIYFMNPYAYWKYAYPVGLVFYDSNKNITGSQLLNAWNKTANITAGQYAYVRMTFNIDAIDNTYMKDNTNNQYLWKGKNVT